MRWKILALLVLLLLAGVVYLGLQTGRETSPAAGEDQPAPLARPAAALAPSEGSGEAAAPAGNAAAAAAPRPAPAAGRLVIQAGWGTRAGEFGRREGQEGAPEAPMSLAVDSDGRLLVLDQVNSRLQRYGPSGRHLGTVAIGTDTAQDVAVAPDGDLLVLDRLGQDPSLQVFDGEGQPQGKLPVVGGTVKEGGGISGVFADSDGIYVEDAHDDLVKVAGAGGAATDLSGTIPGRPTRDGALYIKAAIIDRQTGKLYVQAHRRADKTLAWETPMTLPAPILHLLLLDSDRKGKVYVAAEVGREDPQTYKTTDVVTLVVRLDGAGQITGPPLVLPPTTADPAEVFRPLVVADDGTIFHLVAGPAGITVHAYKFPG